MRSVLENYRDSTGAEIQPYYAAFMIEHGFRTVEEGRNEQGNQTPYMLWIQSRWGDFQSALGISQRQRYQYRTEFHQWLSRRALDHLARNAVEAA